VDVDTVERRVAAIKANGKLKLAGTHPVGFHNRRQLIMNKRGSLPAHPNGMIFTAYDISGDTIAERTFFSVGGGFVVEPDEHGQTRIVEDTTEQAYPFVTGEQLLTHCRQNNLSISDVMLANEGAWRSEAAIRAGILRLWSVMKACIDKGCSQQGHLPGGLNVRRRAAKLHADLSERAEQGDP